MFLGKPCFRWRSRERIRDGERAKFSGKCILRAQQAPQRSQLQQSRPFCPFRLKHIRREESLRYRRSTIRTARLHRCWPRLRDPRVLCGIPVERRSTEELAGGRFQEPRISYERLSRPNSHRLHLQKSNESRKSSYSSRSRGAHEQREHI